MKRGFYVAKEKAGFGRAVKKRLAFGAAAIGLAILPLGASAQTLGDAMASAYKSSGLLEQNRANLRATDEGVAAAVAAMRPSLNYTFNVSRSFTGQSPNNDYTAALTFAAGMDLYTFGRNKLNIAAAKETVLATRQSLVNLEQQVLANAILAFQGVREAQAVVNLRQNAVRLNTQNLRAARNRFELGDITRTSVSQVEAQLAGAKAQLSAAQGQLASARENYKIAVGSYPNRLKSPPHVKLPASSADAAVRLARSGHPLIKALQHRVAASDIAVEVAERNLFPTVSASANKTFSRSGGDDILGDYSTTFSDSGSLSLGVRGPIYSGGALTSNIRRTVALRDASRAELLQTSREIEQNVRTSWSLLSVYSASEQADMSLVKAQRVAFEGVREEADLGAATTLDVLNAEQDLLNAQVSAISSRIQRETQSYAVLQALGLLTVKHLNLNVPVYDPSAYYKAVEGGTTNLVSPQGEKLENVLKALGRN